MKQSDILSFAINGVQRELEEAHKEYLRLAEVLKELQELDVPLNAKPSIGRPEGFKYEPLVVCKFCRMDPCGCGRKNDD